MELPLRSKGDELLPPGAMVALRDRLKALASRNAELTTVISYAFDYRTRMLPYLFADKRMAPAGPRMLADHLVDAGFERTRLVLGQWNRAFRPSTMRLDGRVPDLYLVSSLSVHSGHMTKLLEDVRRIPADQRPLVLAGGPHVVYEPWRVFGGDPAAPFGADGAVTGEVYVFLELLERLLEARGGGEPLRAVFQRVRDGGGLDDIPGLVYPRGAVDGVAEELVDTGVQRLLADFDELASPVLGYGVLEAPSFTRKALAPRPLAPNRVARHAQISSLPITQGCKFRCPYCPIPAYNQFKDRTRSPARLVEDFRAIHGTYGIKMFFGTDDNFFNRHERTLAYFEALAAAEATNGKPLGKSIRWGTEVTVHDTYELRPHLKLARRAGVRALWLGVEDMTATLVKKGQSVNKTVEVFDALNEAGIHPMPMMMHDDSQPLLTLRSPRGLMNQVGILRKHGAVALQVTSLLPAPGTKLYKETFQSGLAFDKVGGKPVEAWRVDGNHIVASHHKRPWQRQINMILIYAYFYNPVRWLVSLVRPKCRRGYLRDFLLQTIGMIGLTWNVVRLPPWMVRLMFGKIERPTKEPTTAVPMRAVSGGLAAHDVPAGPDPKKVRRLDTAPEVAPLG